MTCLSELAELGGSKYCIFAAMFWFAIKIYGKCHELKNVLKILLLVYRTTHSFTATKNTTK